MLPLYREPAADKGIQAYDISVLQGQSLGCFF